MSEVALRSSSHQVWTIYIHQPLPATRVLNVAVMMGLKLDEAFALHLGGIQEV